MDADLIVIGSGQGGVPLASDFAKEGHHVLSLNAMSWVAVVSTMVVRLLRHFWQLLMQQVGQDKQRSSVFTPKSRSIFGL